MPPLPSWFLWPSLSLVVELWGTQGSMVGKEFPWHHLEKQSKSGDCYGLLIHTFKVSSSLSFHIFFNQSVRLPWTKGATTKEMIRIKTSNLIGLTSEYNILIVLSSVNDRSCIFGRRPKIERYSAFGRSRILIFFKSVLMISYLQI